ncbi:hypothetical protein F4V47_01370 [Lactococcus garvieae subsp. garvieae]|uniref:hypothetical protein n=1 Tax=Lactococcus garvieae TaxID=1363 RepID=UPI000B227B13|nr:hypothetical protein [Lactococcus garvieae]KAA8718799.1 hypothetical protein F4V47_01370 [Lactococcus garvieae subsp. garvieae]MDG6191163.1 hypothetical protein [Lactococcus garvieae]PCS00313.1 hypothetical protein RU85_GL000733 [Lactococcus garvieae]QPR48998.1 hypothetical protein I6G86_00440 [Lactococcus garvieae]
MAIVLEKQTLHGKVYVWQDDNPQGTKLSRIEIKWRNPEGRLIKSDSEVFDRLPLVHLKAKFEKAVELVENPEWIDEQEKNYIERLELEIADRQRKIQLAKLTKRLGEAI